MQSQDVLQRALRDYEGSVLIVSHNRDFLDTVVTKTLEFRPGEQPRLFSGNIAYYLDKTAEESGTAKPAAASAPSRGTPSATPNRKDQRRAEAEAREQRNKLLKPLETELEALEKKIAEYEAAQAALTKALSSDEVAADPDKLHQTSTAVANVTGALETCYSRWSDLSEEIEKVRTKLGIQE